MSKLYIPYLLYKLCLLFLPQKNLEPHPEYKSMIGEFGGRFIFSSFVNASVIAIIPQRGFFE